MPEPTPTRGRPTLSQDALAERRDEIASVALRLFLSEGFASVSMRRLGKEVGLTPMALYRYYPSKLDILARLWGYIIGKAFEGVTAAAHGADTPEDALSRAAQAYVSYWCENKDHYHLVFMNPGVTDTDVRSFVGEEETIAQYDVFFQAVAKVRSADRMAPSVKIATDGLICHLHGIMHSLITIQGYPWTEADTLVADAVERVGR
ncbi:TetR/AcrR family transcriptional regulator [uncultured Tateyamaria sp.]|uniref:TetR/AcrR family transcriptional regulator n=1 Tax=uncultured Tateyamaria sp. TaxID=455651 RepID=UPI00261FE768|nr:TetR/AcrR family transcriptional regulator [uncultured Tateyamaria sp.]